MTNKSKYVSNTYIVNNVRDIRGQFERDMRELASLKYEDGTCFLSEQELVEPWYSTLFDRVDNRYTNEKIEAMWVGYYLSAKKSWAQIPEKKLQIGVRDHDAAGERGGTEYYCAHTFFFRSTDTEEDFLTKAILPYNTVHQNFVQGET